jgi:hypothetical protein
MVIPILLLSGFAAASAYAFHRWRTPGIAVLCVALIVIESARGTVRWMRPHTHHPLVRPWDWGCHSMGILVPVVILGSGVGLALHLAQNRYTSIGARLVISGLVCVLLAAPAILGLLWWIIGILQCDTM